MILDTHDEKLGHFLYEIDDLISLLIVIVMFQHRGMNLHDYNLTLSP